MLRFPVFAGPAWAPLIAVIALVQALPSHAQSPLPRPEFLRVQPAALELNWTPLKMPTGERIALLGTSYMLAMDEDWGVGPSVYGAAKGNYGGVFTVGFTAQRRWAMGRNSHVAASLYAGAGGGLSSPQVSFGGGLMLRPEISLRTEWGNWYSGIGLAHTRFPSGNVSGTSLGLVLGYADGFRSYAPNLGEGSVSTFKRSGFGFDEIVATAGTYQPRRGSLSRSGTPVGRMGKAGAALRQYVSDGAWWGIEAAGAAQGGADGYMEVLAGLGQDYALGSANFRGGWHASVGLGGGGNVNTGNGWLIKAGPTLRWATPWGPSLHMDAGLSGSVTGQFRSNYVRLGLGLPLDKAFGRFGEVNETPGVLRTQTVYASLQQLPKVRFKDGRRESVGHIAMVLARDLGGPWYGTAQAGSAAFGSAGAYSFGLFGLGLQSQAGKAVGWRFGGEVLVGAAGGGGVDVQGGAVMQSELWGQWERERLRLRVGVGEWRTLRGQTQSSPVFHLGLGYAFGAVTR